MDINRVDFGTAFLPQNQDPTLAASTTPGATAVVTDLMRAFRGYSSITQTSGWLDRTYHSLQLSLQRRFRNGLSFGFNDTIGLYDRQNTDAAPPARGGRDVSIRADQAEADELLGDNNPQAHIIKANFVWDLPDMRGGSRLAKAIGRDRQRLAAAGIWTAATGSAYAVGYSYNNGGGNVNLTGSPDYGGRIRIVGDTGSGCSSDPYRQFNAAAFQGPLRGSVGLESGNNYLKGCFQSALDMSLQRTINLGGGRAIQLRADVFNVFNEARMTGRNTTVNFVNPSDPGDGDQPALRCQRQPGGVAVAAARRRLRGGERVSDAAAGAAADSLQVLRRRQDGDARPPALDGDHRRRPARAVLIGLETWAVSTCIMLPSCGRVAIHVSRGPPATYVPSAGSASRAWCTRTGCSSAPISPLRSGAGTTREREDVPVGRTMMTWALVDQDPVSRGDRICSVGTTCRFEEGHAAPSAPPGYPSRKRSGEAAQRPAGTRDGRPQSMSCILHDCQMFGNPAPPASSGTRGRS